MSEEKKKTYYYYKGKEKRAIDVKRTDEEIMPFSFSDMQRDFDSMMERFQQEFADLWDLPFRWKHSLRKHGLPIVPFSEPMLPSIDLEDRGKEFRLLVDLPGFSKDDVELEVSDDSLIIHAKKDQAKEQKSKNYVRRERAAQSYYRRIILPEKIHSDDAKATLTNGILEVILPKKEPKQTKRLAITEKNPESEDTVGASKHIAEHSLSVTEIKGQFMCPECGKMFEIKDAAEKHLHLEHRNHLKTMHKEYHSQDIGSQHVV